MHLPGYFWHSAFLPFYLAFLSFCLLLCLLFLSFRADSLCILGAEKSTRQGTSQQGGLGLNAEKWSSSLWNIPFPVLLFPSILFLPIPIVKVLIAAPSLSFLSVRLFLTFFFSFWSLLSCSWLSAQLKYNFASMRCWGWIQNPFLFCEVSFISEKFLCVNITNVCCLLQNLNAVNDCVTLLFKYWGAHFKYNTMFHGIVGLVGTNFQLLIT